MFDCLFMAFVLYFLKMFFNYPLYNCVPKSNYLFFNPLKILREKKLSGFDTTGIRF